MSDDTPTQRFDAQPTPGTPAGDAPKSRLPLILGIVGGVLLLVVILLLVLLLKGPGTPQAAGTTVPTASATATTSASPTTAPETPTAAPTESHTSAPPPPASTEPAFTKFVVQSSINSCSSGPYYTGTPPTIEVTWATIRTDSAWIVQGTSDAADSKFMQIPVSGNQSNFPYQLNFSCGSPTSTYTITIVGSNGKHLSKHWTIKNTTPGQ